MVYEKAMSSEYDEKNEMNIQSASEEQRRKKCIFICGPFERGVKRLHKQEEALKPIFLGKAGCARKGGGFIKVDIASCSK